MTKIMEVRSNLIGTDYFVGDIHGCFEQLERGMELVEFNPAKDRLFIVGDLVDRGPQSYRVAEFLSRKYVYAIQGNHDCSTYWYARNVNMHFHEHDKDTRISHDNGGQWVLSASRQALEDFMEAVKYLPMAIEYQDKEGKPLLGLIHGEISMGSSWTELTHILSELPWDHVMSLVLEQEDILYKSLYGRTKIRAHLADPKGAIERFYTEGIPFVACGHTIVPQVAGEPFAVANNRYIDHGLYQGSDSAKLYTLDQLIGNK